MKNQNRNHIAEAHYSSMSRTITTRIDLENLPVSQQVSLLSNLLRDSGVIAALSELSNKDEVFKVIDEALAAYNNE